MRLEIFRRTRGRFFTAREVRYFLLLFVYSARREGFEFRRECDVMIRVKMLKRLSLSPRRLSPPSAFFCATPYVPSVPIILLSFSAKTDATYLSADTAGLPSTAPTSCCCAHPRRFFLHNVPAPSTSPHPLK